MAELTFPYPYREGQKVITPLGTVTVGVHRKTTVSDEIADYLVSSNAEGFFEGNEALTMAERKDDAARERAQHAVPVVLDPTRDLAGYERHATRMEAAKRAQHAAEFAGKSAIVDHATEADVNDEGHVQIGDPDGPVVGAAESAALKRRNQLAAARAAKAAKNTSAAKAQTGSALDASTSTPAGPSAPAATTPPAGNA